ncbi:MAG TPA: wax ester/triacylglycerol synthase family O-acyltransferase [Actinomycetota bacterium]|nr:wax ester/triacylglycerol synthase family O-acyltransferase [Actinomycetota bacterium]
MTIQRLSALDAQFLYLERPEVHMHVAGIAILDPSTRPDGRLSIEHIVELIRARIHLVPRFRQKIVSPPLGVGRPVWVDDPNFDLSFHIRHAALPAPGGPKELAAQVQRVHSRPLDRSKPLWEMYFIEGLEDGHVAVLTKSHHAMIDGMSGMDIATVLFDFTPEPREVAEQPYEPQPEPSSRDLFIQSVAEQVAHPVRSAIETIGSALRAPQAAAETVQRTLGGFAALFARGQAPASPFNVKVGPNRRFAMAEVPVTDAKLIKNELGGKVNDVVLAAVAGALDRLLGGRGIDTRGLTLRTMVPVSTRDAAPQTQLGNKISSLFVDLPIGVEDPVERLRQIVAATKDVKRSHQAVAAGMLMNLGQWAPPTIHGMAARAVARQRFINLVVSNVPGPQVPLYLAGAKMLVTYPVMPLGETVGLSVAVTSLSGVMGFGFTADWDAVPDIDELPKGLLASIAELKKAASG